MPHPLIPEQTSAPLRSQRSRPLFDAPQVSDGTL